MMANIERRNGDWRVNVIVQNEVVLIKDRLNVLLNDLQELRHVI